jgi:tRNA(fMet)-specific endonuclease VapC
MLLLDTDHMTVLERGGASAQRLRERLVSARPEEAATTVISYEEQTRGWLSYVARARSVPAQIEAYGRLKSHLTMYCAIPVVEFDQRAAEALQRLQRSRLRIGTMDLKIAAIALTHSATLLSRNLSDFARVTGLRVEDWTG